MGCLCIERSQLLPGLVAFIALCTVSAAVLAQDNSGVTLTGPSESDYFLGMLHSSPDYVLEDRGEQGGVSWISVALFSNSDRTVNPTMAVIGLPDSASGQRVFVVDLFLDRVDSVSLDGANLVFSGPRADPNSDTDPDADAVAVRVLVQIKATPASREFLETLLLVPDSSNP